MHACQLEPRFCRAHQVIPAAAPVLVRTGVHFRDGNAGNLGPAGGMLFGVSGLLLLLMQGMM